VWVISSWVLPLGFLITTIDLDENNTLVPVYLFSKRKPPPHLLHEHVLLYDLLYLWLFNNKKQLTTSIFTRL
jgi:hypothetical protein